MTKNEKNLQAYEDVLDCHGPSMRDDAEYMEFYRQWYPLGAEAARDREDVNMDLD